jgi:hypothetical protein
LVLVKVAPKNFVSPDTWTWSRQKATRRLIHKEALESGGLGGRSLKLYSAICEHDWISTKMYFSFEDHIDLAEKIII